MKIVQMAGICAFCFVCLQTYAQQAPVTVSDCVRTRRVEPNDIRISPDGKSLAYIVRSPNLESNRNDYLLYVRNLGRATRPENGRLLLQAESLSGLQWLGESTQVSVLSRIGEKNEISLVNVATGTRTVQISRPETIEDYSVDASGNVIAFSVRETSRSQRPYGYSVLTQTAAVHLVSQNIYQVYVATSSGRGQRDIRRVMPKERFFGVQRLSISPDGNYLTFSHFLFFGKNTIPDSWINNPYVKMAKQSGDSLAVVDLYDLRDSSLHLAINSPHGDSRTAWSGDSKAFFVSVMPPIEDDYWRTLTRDSLHSVMDSPIFRRRAYTVDVATAKVSQVLPGFSEENEGPISWKTADGEMIVRIDDHTYGRMRRDGEKWRETNRFSSKISESLNSDAGNTTGNENVLIGLHESATDPPDLFYQRIGSDQETRLTDLNPELQSRALGEVTPLEWSNRYGAQTTGFLIKPVGYREGQRYPLVILSYGGWTGFICDGGYFHTTAFAPQPLAASGFVVLLANMPDSRKQPAAYPGELGEAYNHTAMIESAVSLLAERGIADLNNVGLVGWSRTSWKTDFLLTHSDLKVTAASSADGGRYNSGMYWRLLGLRGKDDEDEAMYGGPPYGTTASNWLNYAPAFNANQVKAPLLMECTAEDDFGVKWQLDPYTAFEFFTALRRQGKPVDLFFYPEGKHELESPFERVASLQRNVDWFRFWMQKYEGKAPAYDPDQYVRWRKLRNQQEWNERMRLQGKDPSVEFLKQTMPGEVLEDADRAPAAKEFIH